MTAHEARRLRIGETIMSGTMPPSQYAGQVATVVQRDRKGFTLHWTDPELPDDWCPYEAKHRLHDMQRTGAPKHHQSAEELAAEAAQDIIDAFN